MLYMYIKLLSSCFFINKELITSDGCVEMVIPWQLCRTIGPLLSQRFPLASAKAQPMGGILTSDGTPFQDGVALCNCCDTTWRPNTETENEDGGQA